jgi:hypothetical protein
MSTQIVRNTGTNYSLYYNAINYFKTIMGNHPSIGSVTFGDAWDIGERQFPEYPIGNILILESDFGTNVTDYKIQLIVADKVKNKNNESDPTNNEQLIPLYGVDDKTDIWANTLAIINDLTSYTQRGVAGFEINDDIVCTPFAERFDNGLAGWQAEFTLTTHNDRNRCLFNLINPNGTGYIIEECLSGVRYKAVLSSSGSIGQVFATSYVPPQSQGNITTSYGYDCYSIIATFNNQNDYDLVNLPILALPYTDFGDCETCLKWIEPQIWGTTFQNWSSGSNVTHKTWSNA